MNHEHNEKKVEITSNSRVPLWTVGSAFCLGVGLALYFNTQFSQLKAQMTSMQTDMLTREQAQMWIDNARADNAERNPSIFWPPLPTKDGK